MADGEDGAGRGWVEIGHWRWFTPALTLLFPTVTVVASFAWVLARAGALVGRPAAAALPGVPVVVLDIAAFLIIVAVVFAITTLVQRMRYPRVCVDLAGGRIRIGRAELDVRDLIWARLDVRWGLRRKRRDLVLRLGAGLHPQALFDLTSTGPRGLSLRDRELLLAVIDASDIDVPKTRDDPTGRFARFNFPNNVTKADARALVQSPPGPGDPLPIPAPRQVVGRP